MNHNYIPGVAEGMNSGKLLLKQQSEVTNRLKYLLLVLYAFSFILFAFFINSPREIIFGLKNIIQEPGGLITDFIIIGGIGAAFVNAGLLMLISIGILLLLKVNITGISIAAVFLIGGFALFGKNILNVWLIIIGVWIYTLVKREKLSKNIYVALFGTSMAPVISELFFGIDQPFWFRAMIGLVVGLSIGFLLTPLSTHLVKVHQGFNLYNIGFTAGILGTIFVSIFRSYGYVSQSKLIWSSGNDLLLGSFLGIQFVAMIVGGLYLGGNLSLRKLKAIFSYSGKTNCDFVSIEGLGATLINMGLNGFIAMGYVLLVGGAINGPTIGGILSIVGFGAYGKHARNIIPIFIGVFLGSITKIWSINDPAILFAALFGTGLAPIAGHYGWLYGVAAGFINSSVVLNSGILHGGLNLYNTGFSAGIVAAVMIPVIDAFKKKKENVVET